MICKAYVFRFLIRVFLLISLIIAAIIFCLQSHLVLGSILVVFSVVSLYNLYLFTSSRFRAIDDFFEAVKYKDFSRWFVEDSGPADMKELYKRFNEVNRTFKTINSKSEAQYLYLQKILEMVNVGIIAYNLESGAVLWANESLRETLDFPSFKNINFVAKRKPELYEAIFETYHPQAQSIAVEVKSEKIKILISDTVFQVEEEAFKLVVLQNIDDTLNRNESEAWKKLLSVMTHEIMNSIAPITSLAETLEKQLQLASDDVVNNPLEIADLHAGVKTIKTRSEGLLKFARTYRSLNKITHLNLDKVIVKELFNGISLLMEPSLKAKNIEVSFAVDNANLEIEMDIYLIEQVLINLLLNAIEACVEIPNPQIKILAQKSLNGPAMIKVKDNGKGVSSEIIDSIFVPFFSSKKNGSGIGLSLCKQIMILHKGKIQVNSSVGEGTVMSLVFNE